MELRLVRVAEHNGATLGTLAFDGLPELVTLENAWRQNKRVISCIPPGTYKIKRKVSPRFGLTYEVCNVQGRTHILFHVGNTHVDTSGCILVGGRYGTIRGESAVLNSRVAMQRFMERLKDHPEAVLTIVDATGRI